MKKLVSIVLFFTTFFLTTQAANFKSGEKITLTEVEQGDYYIAGGVLKIKSKIYGDLIATGGEISIHDTIFGDVWAAGGKIMIQSFIEDDVRITGGEITIDGEISGDLIVFGGEVTITENGKVLGDVICFSGELEIYGAIFGNLRSWGGEVEIHNDIEKSAFIKCDQLELNGHVIGDLEFSASELEVGENANCSGIINYWLSKGEMDLSKVGTAHFDKSLAVKKRDFNWAILGTVLGIGFIAYWIIFIVSAFLLLMFLQRFMGKYFIQAADTVKNSMMKSLGSGMLYFFGVPVASLFLMFSIIGLPIGILGMSIYALSLLYATTVCGLVISHYFERRSNQHWSYFQNIGYALLTVIILKIIFFIPILGTLIKILVMAGIYGAFLLMMMEKQSMRKNA